MGAAMVSHPARTLLVEVLVSQASLSHALRLSAAGESLLIDCGEGVARALRAPSGRSTHLLGVAFTHGHPDHVAGLYAALAALRALGRVAPLEILMPAGCREPAILLDAWRRRYAGSRDFPTPVREVRGGRAARVGAFRLRPFRVRHRGDRGGGRQGLLPAVGYEIFYRGLRVVVSGDTGPCPALDQAARGADLALIEATFPRSRPADVDLHLSVPQARKVGRRARRYGLVHLTAASRALVRPGEALRRYRLEVPREY
jgi:ribonuclease BN (tRNA processing enzyme)